MGDGLSIQGGAGGVAAHYDDLLSVASLFDVIADDLGEASVVLASISLNPDIAQAAVLCPIEAARAEAALAEATVGPRSAAALAGRSELSAHLLRFSVEVYRDADAMTAKVCDALWATGGFVAGSVGSRLLIADAPVLAPLGFLGYRHRDGLLSNTQRTLYDNPWLEDATAKMAPGLVQGSGSGLVGGNPLLVGLVTEGHWPSPDLQSALRGLLVLGKMGDGLNDEGRFAVASVNDPAAVDFGRSAFLEQAMAQQQDLSGRAGQVQIVAIDGPSGPAYVVQIPGTQEWSPKRGDNPVDLSTNIHLEAGLDTKMARAVTDAMRAAGIPSDAPVMLIGHSQGGIAAAAIASDPGYRSEFNIRAIVTAGSPIGRMDIPGSVSVLSLEEKQDLVPKLDGAENPDRPTWVTVTRDLKVGDAPASAHDLDSAHSLTNYRQTAHFVDRSDDPSLVAWRGQNSEFFGPGSRQHYQISRVDGE